MKKFISEFKEFISRGNVMDLAVGMIIGSAFTGIVNSLVNDIVMPFISMLTGGIDFSSWKWVLKAAEGDAAEVAVNFGRFIAVVLDFIIIAFAVFCMVKAINKFHKKKEEAPAAPPEPSAEEKLLTEIRDLLKEKQ